MTTLPHSGSEALKLTLAGPGPTAAPDDSMHLEVA